MDYYELPNEISRARYILKQGVWPENWPLSQDILKVLGEMGNPDAIRPILTLAARLGPIWREDIEPILLNQFATPKAFKTLTSIVNEPPSRKIDLNLAFKMLAKIGDLGAIEPMINAIESRKVGDEAQEIVEQFLRRKGSQSIPVLLKILSGLTKDYEHVDILKLLDKAHLGWAKTQAAAGFEAKFIENLSQTQLSVRMGAIRVLEQMGGPETEQALLWRLKSKDEPSKIKISTATALARCGNEDTLVENEAMLALLRTGSGLARFSGSAFPSTDYKTEYEAFLRSAGTYLGFDDIFIFIHISSDSDGDYQEDRQTFEQKGYCLCGLPEGKADKIATESGNMDTGNVSTRSFLGEGEKTVWLLTTGELLYVKTTKYRSVAALSFSSSIWEGEQSVLSYSDFLTPSFNTHEALVRCCRELFTLLKPLYGEKNRELENLVIGIKGFYGK